jgi:hypothetical protein
VAPDSHTMATPQLYCDPMLLEAWLQPIGQRYGAVGTMPQSDPWPRLAAHDPIVDFPWSLSTVVYCHHHVATSSAVAECMGICSASWVIVRDDSGVFLSVHGSNHVMEAQFQNQWDPLDVDRALLEGVSGHPFGSGPEPPPPPALEQGVPKHWNLTNKLMSLSCKRVSLFSSF